MSFLSAVIPSFLSEQTGGCSCDRILYGSTWVLSMEGVPMSLIRYLKCYTRSQCMVAVRLGRYALLWNIDYTRSCNDQKLGVLQKLMKETYSKAFY